MRSYFLAAGLAAAGLCAVTGCGDSTSSTTRTNEQKARDAGAAVGRTADKAVDAAGKAADKTGDALHKAGESANDAAKRAGDKLGGAADATGDALKDNVVKPVEAEYPKFEDKIKSLSGDAAKTAREKFDVVKRLVSEFRAAAAPGLDAAKTKLMDAVNDLRKALGL